MGEINGCSQGLFSPFIELDVQELEILQEKAISYFETFLGERDQCAVAPSPHTSYNTIPSLQ